LQYRGLAAPRGARRLDLSAELWCAEPGAPADARGLSWLLRSLLQPDGELATLASWSPAADARVVAFLASRGEAFVLAIDAAQRRLQLRRWDAASGSYRTRSADPAEIAAFFAERCWPDRLDFERLRTWGVTPPEAWPEAPDDDTLPTASSLLLSADSSTELARVQIELERTRAAAVERAHAQQRLAARRAELERVAELERELARTCAELEEQAPLAAVSSALERRIAAFRAEQEARDAVRQEIGAARRALLAERSALRAAAERHRAPLGLGVAAFALGSALAGLGEWLGGAVAALGALLAGIALAQRRAARRHLGRIEAVLAGQRVRERTADQRFDSETEPLRAAMAALDLQSVDQLPGALEANLALAKSAADLQSALGAARTAQRDASAEIAQLEQQLATPDPTPRVLELEELVARLTRERAGPAAARSADAPAAARARPDPDAELADPDELVAAAARGTGVSADELRGRMGGALPLYLRALCAGDLTHARYRPPEGWVLSGPARRGVQYPELPVELRSRVAAAFRLALAERTATERSTPFVIGPDLPALEPAECEALERALRRLSGFVQVLRAPV
jgi:hypothetical protein